MTINYEIVDDSLREAIEKVNTRRRPNPVIDAMAEGKTVFIEEANGDKLNTFYDAARRRGFKFTMMKVEHNSKVGHLGWFVKREEEQKSA